MKKLHVLVTIFLLIAAIYFIVKPLIPVQNLAGIQSPENSAKSNLKLTSSAFGNYQKIPAVYTCQGKKISPPFTIENVPHGTQSLVLIVDDPDAPVGTFTHWILWNIDPTLTQIQQGRIPDRSQEGTTSAGKPGYVPFCPPTGEHRYFFNLFALDTKLGLDGKARKTDVETAMKGHIMDQFLLIGVYGK